MPSRTGTPSRCWSRVLAQPWWPSPLMRTTGWSPLTASSSVAVGRRDQRAERCPQPCRVTPGGSCATASATRRHASSGERQAAASVDVGLAVGSSHPGAGRSRAPGRRRRPHRHRRRGGRRAALSPGRAGRAASSRSRRWQCSGPASVAVARSPRQGLRSASGASDSHTSQGPRRAPPRRRSTTGAARSAGRGRPVDPSHPSARAAT